MTNLTAEIKHTIRDNQTQILEAEIIRYQKHYSIVNYTFKENEYDLGHVRTVTYDGTPEECMVEVLNFFNAKQVVQWKKIGK